MRNFIIILISFLPINFLFGQNVELWGTAPQIGTDGIGGIFKVDKNGSYITEFSFPSSSAKEPENTILCEAFNGNLYGVTSGGGINSLGVIFFYNPENDEYKEVYHFDNSNFNMPSSSFMQSSDSNLYSTTKFGGTHNMGGIFKFDIRNDSVTFLVDFDSLNGSFPEFMLVEDSLNNLYGVTKTGGLNNKGVLFKYSTLNNSLTKLFDFGDTLNEFPNGGLIKASNGLFYGVTSTYSFGVAGTIYEFNASTNLVTKLVEFDPAITGSRPFGKLVEAPNGLFYGSCNYYIQQYGTHIFEFNKQTNSLTFKKTVSLNIQNQSSKAGLTLISNNELIGISPRLGINNEGQLFKYSINNNLVTVIHEFDTTASKWPTAGVVRASNGKFYGLTNKLFKNGLYEYDNLKTSVKNIVLFGTGYLGEFPTGELLYSDNGMFYGITKSGGANGFGVIFEYNPKTTKLKRLLSLDFNKGSGSQGGLIQIKGDLYGVTLDGGLFHRGAIFKYSIQSKSFSILHSFSMSGTDGYSPFGTLLNYNDSLIYGMTREGGQRFNFVNSQGTLFEFNLSTNLITKKVDFNDANNIGHDPYSSLFKASNNLIYGTCRAGGNYGLGSFFEFNPITDSAKSIAALSNTVNSVYAGVTESNDVLYGVTNTSNGGGQIFRYDLKTKLGGSTMNLNTTLGNGYYSPLFRAKNDKLYFRNSNNTLGNGNGSILEYDPQIPAIRTVANIQAQTFPSGNTNCYGGLIDSSICRTSFINGFSVSNTNICRMDSAIFQLDSNSTLGSGIAWGLYDSLNSNLFIDSSYNGTFILKPIKTKKYYIKSFGCFNISNSIDSFLITVRSIDSSITQTGNTLSTNNTGALYQWLDCSSNYSVISGETNSIYNPSINGSYAVEIIKQGCTDTTDCYSFIATSIPEEINGKKLNVFPNPSSGQYTVEMNEQFRTNTIRIIDLQGKEIEKYILKSKSRYTFFLEKPDGIYFLEINLENGEKLYQKIIKN